MNTVPSKYIKELRILSDKMCDTNDKHLIIELRKAIESSKIEVYKKTTLKAKIRNYEQLCITITKLLQTIH